MKSYQINHLGIKKAMLFHAYKSEFPNSNCAISTMQTLVFYYVSGLIKYYDECQCSINHAKTMNELIFHSISTNIISQCSKYETNYAASKEQDIKSNITEMISQP